MKIFIALIVIAFIAYGCKDKLATNTNDVQLTHKNVDVHEAKTMISQNPDIVVLDVRTPGETAQGMIQNAIEIDYNGSDFAGKVSKLDKSKTYLVYCKSGGRSARASKQMINAGFTDVTNMKGGYSAWK